MNKKPKIFVTFTEEYYTFHNLRSKLCDKFDVEFSSTDSVSKEELIKKISGVYGIFCTHRRSCFIDKDVLDAAGSSLKVITTCSAGYEHLDLNEIKSRGIRIGCASRAICESTAEFAISLALIVGREINYFISLLKNGISLNRSLLKRVQGLEDAVIGIVGSGRIGISVATKVKSFKIKQLLYYNRSQKPEMNNLGGERTSLEELMKQCDYIFITIAYCRDTHHLINEKMIDLMKSQAILINIARGGIIDQDALLNSLQNNKIRGVGLDVTNPEPLPIDHPLLKLNNAVITPHIGNKTDICLENAINVSVGNLIAVLENEEMPEEL